MSKRKIFDKNNLKKYVFPELFPLFKGPDRAHMGPKNKNISHASYQQSSFFHVNSMFVDSFNVLFRFLAEICFRAIIKLPQKASLGTKACSFGTSITLP